MDMTVPQHIQQQMEDAQAMQQQLYGEKEAPASAENTPTPEKVADPVVAPPTESEQKVESVKAETPPDEESFHKRYEVLKGKFDAEVPRLHQQLREQEARMRDLLARLEQKEKQPEPKAEDERYLTDKDNEEFGQDLIDMTRRAAREEVRTEVRKLLTQLDDRFKALMGHVGQVEERVVLSESEKFWNRVKGVVSDWEQVDANPDWISFLDTSPEYTTETYRELAAKAIAAGDAGKVAALVKIWRGEPAAKTPEAPKQPHPDLQRQVAPSTAKVSTPPSGKRMYSQQDYEALFDPRNPLGLAAKDLEAAQLDAQLALAEGRVRW